jgi:hypothetical protein
MSRRKKANIRKMQVYHDYYCRLKNIALACFEWDGLPNTCNQKFLEKCLYSYGSAIFVNDKNLGFLNLKVTPSSEMNVYEEYTYFNAFSVGYNEFYKADECVYIRNNMLEKSTESTTILFAERLAKIQLAIEMNVNAQKTPFLILCDDKSKLSLERLFEQYEDDIPVIFGSKTLYENPVQNIVTNAPFVADKLREEKRAVLDEYLEFLGINTNPSNRKKERLIIDEVQSNNEEIEVQANSLMLTRQEACMEINEKFGLNVSVKKRFDEKGVDDNGELYDRAKRDS